MVSVSRLARAFACSAFLLLPGTVTPAAGQQSEGVQTRSAAVQQQFDRVSQYFTIGPYYVSGYLARSSPLRSDDTYSPYFFSSSYFSPAYFSSSYFSRTFRDQSTRGPYADPFLPGPDGYSLGRNPSPPSLVRQPAGDDPFRSDRDPYSGTAAPSGPLRDEIPLPIPRERRVTDIILTAGVRALLYVAAVGLLAQMAPKRVWVQVFERNNLALAIVLAAIALALAIVIAAPPY